MKIIKNATIMLAASTLMGSFAIANMTNTDMGNTSGALSSSNVQNQQTVRDAQRALNNEGHSLTVDGRMGPSTTEAIREFQEENDLAVTGTLNSETLSALNVDQGSRVPASVDDRTNDRDSNTMDSDSRIDMDTDTENSDW